MSFFKIPRSFLYDFPCKICLNARGFGLSDVGILTQTYVSACSFQARYFVSSNPVAKNVQNLNAMHDIKRSLQEFDEWKKIKKIEDLDQPFHSHHRVQSHQPTLQLFNRIADICKGIPDPKYSWAVTEQLADYNYHIFNNYVEYFHLVNLLGSLKSASNAEHLFPTFIPSTTLSLSLSVLRSHRPPKSNSGFTSFSTCIPVLSSLDDQHQKVKEWINIAKREIKHQMNQKNDNVVRWDLWDVMGDLAQALMVWKWTGPEQARDLMQAMVDKAREISGKNSSMATDRLVGLALIVRGDLLWCLKEYPLAKDSFQGAVVRLSGSPGLEGSSEHSLALSRAADGLMREDKLKEAEDYIEKAYSIVQNLTSSKMDPRLAEYLGQTGNLFILKGEGTPAEGLHRAAKDKLEKCSVSYGKALNEPRSFIPSIGTVAEFQVENLESYASLLDSLTWNNVARTREGESIRNESVQLCREMFGTTSISDSDFISGIIFDLVKYQIHMCQTFVDEKKE